eukprot:ctg_1306.g460
MPTVSVDGLERGVSIAVNPTVTLRGWLYQPPGAAASERVGGRGHLPVHRADVQLARPRRFERGVHVARSSRARGRARGGAVDARSTRSAVAGSGGGLLVRGGGVRFGGRAVVCVGGRGAGVARGLRLHIVSGGVCVAAAARTAYRADHQNHPAETVCVRRTRPVLQRRLAGAPFRAPARTEGQGGVQ